MDKRFIVILVILVIGLGGLFIFTRNKASAPGSNDTSSNTSVSNHTKGNIASKVNLTVYGDFECPACQQFFPIEKQVVDKYINDISFTFRHFPLDAIHKNARAASRAAEAAGLQAKFFEMHDLLYENYDSWVASSDPLSIFVQMASGLGLKTDQFKTDFASEAVNNTINADYKEGTTKKVEGTPTYFLNGQELKLEEIQTVEQFSAKIDAALKAAK